MVFATPPTQVAGRFPKKDQTRLIALLPLLKRPYNGNPEKRVIFRTKPI